MRHCPQKSAYATENPEFCAGDKKHDERSGHAMRILGSLLLAVVASGVGAAELIIGRASVVDGDTLEVHGRRVRLFGIDAPEAGQTCQDAHGQAYRCGQKAASILEARIGGGVVTCEPTDIDRYGRTVAVCRVFGEDLGAWMVGLGWAVAYRTYSERYVPAEELARRRKLGLWAGRFTGPSGWRQDQRRGG